MPEVRKVRLFVSSPGDVGVERQQFREVVAELNATVARELRLTLEVVAWETDVRPTPGRPQDAINRQIGDYDVFVGVMWRRYGTPTGDAASGTEEEFLDAYRQWQAQGWPKLMFYFCDAPPPEPQPPDAAEQLARVEAFRRRLESDLPLLYTRYADRERFADVLRPHLYRLLVDEFGEGPPLDRSVLDVLELQKELCERADVRFMTPNLLLALLQIADGFAQRAFDSVRQGLAEQLRRSLAGRAGTDAARAGGGFADFRWDDRDDVREARRIAAAAGASSTTDRHLLLALLRGGSNTVAALRRALDDTTVDELAQRVESMPDAGLAAPIATVDPFGELA